MKSLKSYNPLSVSLCFLSVILISMFSLNPIIIMLSFTGGLILYCSTPYCKSKKIHISVFIIIAGCTILNPIFSHNGKTPLLFINNNAVTAEALVYGLFMGIMVAGALYWFAVYSEIMTADKVVHSVGRFFPKSALMLTLALRFIPVYIKKSKEAMAVQKTLGTFKTDSIVYKVKSVMRVFSVMISYMIENTIITSDSMAARGYGGGKRSRYRIFSFDTADWALTAVAAVIGGIYIAVSAFGFLDYSFYPSMKLPGFETAAVAAYSGYFILCLIPTIIEAGDKLKWRLLKSKISPSHTPAAQKQ